MLYERSISFPSLGVSFLHALMCQITQHAAKVLHFIWHLQDSTEWNLQVFRVLKIWLSVYVFFGIETEKLGLEVGNGLPSWKFNDQLFPCDVCGKVFGRQQTLSRHLSLHTGKPMLCGWLLQHWGNLCVHHGLFKWRGKKVSRRMCEPSSAPCT